MSVTFTSSSVDCWRVSRLSLRRIRTVKFIPFCICRSDVLEIEDVILSIDGTSTAGLRQEQVAGLLRAQPGSVVEIEIEYEMPEPGRLVCHRFISQEICFEVQ